MQVGNCFVPRRGSGDNARYARVSCEETLETVRAYPRSNVVWNDPLSACCRCHAVAHSLAALAGTPRPPRAHSAHQTSRQCHINDSAHAHPHASTGTATAGQNLQFDTTAGQYTYLRIGHLLVLTLFSHNYSRNYSGIRSGSPTLTHHSINRHRTPLSRVGPSPGDHLVSALPSGCGLVICSISDVSTHASRTRMSHGINRWDSSLHK